MNVATIGRLKLVSIILNQCWFLKLCIRGIRHGMLKYPLVSLVELCMQERDDDMLLEQIVKHGLEGLFRINSRKSARCDIIKGSYFW